MTTNWSSGPAHLFIEFNPKTSLPKGALAPKVPMDVLVPFQKHIDKFSFEEFKGGSKFLNGDTIMARITPCLENGKTAFVDCLNQDEVGFGSTEYIVLRAKQDISDPNFIYYLSISPEFRAIAIKSMVGSSGRQRVQTEVLAQSSFWFPPLSEQIKIGEFLSLFDRKIAINNRINDYLEQFAEQIFEHEYLRCEQNIEFTNLISIIGGGTPKTTIPEFWNGGIPFFTPKDAYSNLIFTTEKSLSKEGLNKCSSDLFPAGTTFITARGTVGKVCMAGIPMAMNQSCYALKGHKIGPIVTFFLTRKAVKQLKAYATGAVFDAIVTRDFEQIYLGNLSENQATELEEKLSPLFKLIAEKIKENQTLSELRDTLLPKLLSGEIQLT